jgi:hypothetical protein
MLAQMGQMMQLRQAQQGFESENALRDFYAQGGDINKAEDRQRLLSRAPIQGQTILGKESERRARDVVTLGKEYDNARVGLTNVNDETGYYNWVQSSFNNPAIAAHLNQMGITPERALANARATVAKDGLSTAIAKSSMGISEFIKQDLQLQNATKNANIAAASGNRNATVNEQRFAAEQEQRKLVRSILTGGENPSAAPVTGNVSIGGGGGGGGGGGDGAGSSIMVNPSSVNAFNPYTQNNLITQPTPAPNFNAVPRVDQIKQQITQLAKVGGPEANQAMEGLVKEYNILNPAGKIEIGQDGFLRTINERSGVATFVTGADGKPVKGNVTPVIRSVLDQTDPAGKRMIDVNINEHVAGTGLGADGKGAPPKGVLGISSSQIPPNYMIDPKNPQGLIPVPGSAADPRAAVPSGYQPKADGNGFEPIPGGPADPKTTAPSGYRRTASGNLEFIPGSAADPSTVVPPNYRRAANGIDLEFIPGGPADPKVMAAKTTVTLSAKDKESREAKYPQATSALKGFEAKTKQFDSVINELIENKKGLDEITGFFAGRTDVSAMSDAGRRALSLFNTITAKGGFSELQAMRNASPTGGALGNVSNQEGQQLINSFGALARTQSGDDLRKSLATAKSDLQNLKERMREAYDLTYEYRNAGGGGFTYLGREP